jgi:N-succinyl-L-ornithine transcarbamylase
MKYAGVPIINLESSTLHPLQSFADLITIEEHKKVARPKVVLTWAPHPKALPQAVPNSFVEWMKNADVDFVVTNPEGYDLAPEFMDGVKLERDQKEAFKGADFIYAKNWSSYTSYGEILSTDSAWTVSSDKMALTNNAKFMHCLPVRRNVVVNDDVIDSENSIIIAQAANRVTSAQLVIKKILEGK